ncbi:MAG: PDC sensor domain-containing protein [Nitrososphaerota archaeon]|nr:PDC sensor domain-containing protein [Nitrososphaerota archaeon]
MPSPKCRLPLYYRAAPYSTVFVGDPEASAGTAQPYLTVKGEAGKFVGVRM